MKKLLLSFLFLSTSWGMESVDVKKATEVAVDIETGLQAVAQLTHELEALDVSTPEPKKKRIARPRNPKENKNYSGSYCGNKYNNWFYCKCISGLINK